MSLLLLRSKRRSQSGAGKNFYRLVMRHVARLNILCTAAVLSTQHDGKRRSHRRVGQMQLHTTPRTTQWHLLVRALRGGGGHCTLTKVTAQHSVAHSFSTCGKNRSGVSPRCLSRFCNHCRYRARRKRTRRGGNDDIDDETALQIARRKNSAQAQCAFVGVYLPWWSASEVGVDQVNFEICFVIFLRIRW